MTAAKFSRVHVDQSDAHQRRADGSCVLFGLAPMSSTVPSMTYIVQRKDRFYAVAYDGLDPLTGRDRRRWHPAGRDRDEAAAIAGRLQTGEVGAPPRGDPIELGEFMIGTALPYKRCQVRSTPAARN